jgi:hypothetical protein
MKFATALSSSLAVALVSGVAVDKRLNNPTSLDCEELGKFPAFYHGQSSAACTLLVSIPFSVCITRFVLSLIMHRDRRRRDVNKISLTASSFGTSLLASLPPLALVYAPHSARPLFLGLTNLLRPIAFIPWRNARSMLLSTKARLRPSVPMFESLPVAYSSI